MTKWFGVIGFAESKETSTDVWEEVIPNTSIMAM